MWLKIFSSFVFLNVLALLNSSTFANTIYFYGVVTEDTCSATSTHNNCTHVSKVIKSLIKNNKLDHSTIKKSKTVANIKVINKTDHTKMLVVTYH